MSSRSSSIFIKSVFVVMILVIVCGCESGEMADSTTSLSEEDAVTEARSGTCSCKPDPGLTDHSQGTGKTIQRCVNDCSEQVIELKPGTYETKGTINLKSNTTIRGDGIVSSWQDENEYEKPVIQATGIFNVFGGQGTDDVQIQNVKIIGVGQDDGAGSDQDRSCVWISGGDHIVVRDNIIKRCGQHGVHIKHANEVYITNNKIRENGSNPKFHHNIYLMDVTKARVEDSLSRDAKGNGVNVSWSKNVIVKNMTVKYNGQNGVRFAASEKVKAYNVTSTNNGRDYVNGGDASICESDDLCNGIEFQTESLLGGGNIGVTTACIKNNTVKSNDDYWLYLNCVTTYEMYNNTISGNGHGDKPYPSNAKNKSQSGICNDIPGSDASQAWPFTITDDRDGDGISDSLDAFPDNSQEWLDTDNDHLGNNAEIDNDGDGVSDVLDAFFLDGAEWIDADHDDLGDNADIDDDNDGYSDGQDAFPNNPSEGVDTDSDGVGNNADTDDDNDGYLDWLDAFPTNVLEWIDTDGDGTGNNADTDDDRDGVADDQDAFPLDPAESVDTDRDGTGNNADADDDGDGTLDSQDVFPLDLSEWTDTDRDGAGNNSDTDDDNDQVLDPVDAFPTNASEWTDTDNDGTGNNADDDDDNDGTPDVADAFSLDDAEWIDTDGDDVGNNADVDDDGDSVLDDTDAFPLDAAESTDTDADGMGNNVDADDDDDGINDVDELIKGSNPSSSDSDLDGVPDGEDNCILDINAGQDDFDGDAFGDVCDDDDDGDDVSDAEDLFPQDSTAWTEVAEGIMNGTDDVVVDGDADDCDCVEGDGAAQIVYDEEEAEEETEGTTDEEGDDENLEAHFDVNGNLPQTFVGGRGGCHLTTHHQLGPSSGTSVALFSLLGFVLILAKKRKASSILFSLIFMCLLLNHTAVFAQDTGINGFNLDRLALQTDGSGIVNVGGSDVLPHCQFHFGLTTDYGQGFLAATTGAGNVVDIVDHTVTTHATIGLGLWDEMDIGIDVPVTVFEDGINFNTGASFDTSSLDDIWLNLKYRILKDEPHSLGLAAQYTVALPTGDEQKFTGSEDGTHEFRFIFDKKFEHLYLSGNVGYKFTTQRTAINIDDDDTITFGVGASVPLTSSNHPFELVGEVFGSTVIKDTIEITTPVEALGGLRKTFENGLGLTVTGGGGLTSGAGAPLYRVLAGLVYRPQPRRKQWREVLYFDSDKYRITLSQKTVLDEIVERIVKQEKNEVVITGHTDSTQTEEYNLRLSKKRAQSVRNYLKKKSVDQDRVSLEFAGEAQPATTNTTRAGRRLNRRVEIISE